MRDGAARERRHVATWLIQAFVHYIPDHVYFRPRLLYAYVRARGEKKKGRFTNEF